MMSPVVDQLEPLSLQMCGGGSVGEGEGERDIDTQRCGRDGHGIS